jgi:hypothetical protein
MIVGWKNIGNLHENLQSLTKVEDMEKLKDVVGLDCHEAEE